MLSVLIAEIRQLEWFCWWRQSERIKLSMVGLRVAYLRLTPTPPTQSFPICLLTYLPPPSLVSLTLCLSWKQFQNVNSFSSAVSNWPQVNFTFIRSHDQWVFLNICELLVCTNVWLTLLWCDTALPLMYRWKPLVTHTWWLQVFPTEMGLVMQLKWPICLWTFCTR